jgi:hypothetical protein
MLKRCVWAGLALSLAACKSGVPQPPTALPDTCSGDGECAANFRCDPEMRRCVCTGDAACPGKFCNAFTGLCVESVGGCTTDSACAQGQYCNRALRTCRAVTAFCQPCKADAECGAGSACAAHPDFPAAGAFCVPACGAGGACANGLTCKKSAGGASLCFPAAGACGKSNACVPDSLKLCARDADCGDAAQTCDLTLKACVIRARTCPAGDACDPQSKLCVRACTDDDECNLLEHDVGYQCRANACFRRALCAHDADCTNGQICQVNQDGSKSCRAGCVSASDCPLGEGCNAADPNHPRCAAGCTQNGDCPLNTVCSGGACVSTTASCTTQACQDTSVCAIGANCINNCCVAANLATLCPEAGVCGSCPSASPWCTVKCASACFPMNLGPCNVPADCAGKYPPAADVVCNTAVHQCQVWSHLVGCATDSDCPQKGFRCTSASQLGCTGSSLCFPIEQAAQVACAVGYP